MEVFPSMLQNLLASTLTVTGVPSMRPSLTGRPDSATGRGPSDADMVVVSTMAGLGERSGASLETAGPAVSSRT